MLTTTSLSICYILKDHIHILYETLTNKTDSSIDETRNIFLENHSIW